METGTYSLGTGIVPKKQEIEMARPKGVREYHGMSDDGPVERPTSPGSDSAPIEDDEIDLEIRKDESLQPQFVND